MSYKEMARRLAALEQRDRGQRTIVWVNMTFDTDDERRELTPAEAEARLAAAYEEAGPDGIVIRVVYGDWPPGGDDHALSE